MRRIFVLIMLCLLPLQISWAAVVDRCGHEQGKAAQHFGHHDDEHHYNDKQKSSPGIPGDGTQPGQYNLAHDHCHLTVFLCLLNKVALHASVPPVQPSLRCDERTYSSLAPDKPERPKWHALA